MRLIEQLLLWGALSSVVRGDNRSGGDEDRDGKANGKAKVRGLCLRQFMTQGTRRVVMRDASRLRIGDGDTDRSVGMKDRRLLGSVLKCPRCHCGYCSTI